MPSDEIAFLANIAHVAHADGKLSSNEQNMIESVRKELGFKKSDLSAALKLVENGTYAMVPVGSFSNQVRNLAAVLRVAYADSDLGQMEDGLVLSFSTAIGINAEQLERMRAEIQPQLQQQGMKCSICGAESPKDSKFCAKCGNSLVEVANDIQVKTDIPRSGIAIEFAESTSASFPKALELAKLSSGFQPCLKGKKTWYLATFDSGRITEALPLAEALSGLRNRSLYMDGEEQQWDEVFAFIWCSSQRANSYRPVEYCFGKDENRINPWGCKQAKMEWTDWANWFCYGRWEKSGLIGQKVQWRFHKERITHELSTNLFRYRFCPHFNIKLPELILRNMPDTIVPGTNSDWDYHQNYTEVPGAIKVIQQEHSSGFSTSNEFWADGVRPKGLKVLAEILVKSFGDMGADPGLVKALIK